MDNSCTRVAYFRRPCGIQFVVGLSLWEWPPRPHDDINLCNLSYRENNMFCERRRLVLLLKLFQTLHLPLLSLFQHPFLIPPWLECNYDSSKTIFLQRSGDGPCPSSAHCNRCMYVPCIPIDIRGTLTSDIEVGYEVAQRIYSLHILWIQEGQIWIIDRRIVADGIPTRNLAIMMGLTTVKLSVLSVLRAGNTRASLTCHEGLPELLLSPLTSNSITETRDKIIRIKPRTYPSSGRPKIRIHDAVDGY